MSVRERSLTGEGSRIHPKPQARRRARIPIPRYLESICRSVSSDALDVPTGVVLRASSATAAGHASLRPGRVLSSVHFVRFRHTVARRRRNAAVILPYRTGRKIPVTGPERGSYPGGQHREFVRRGRCIVFALARDSWRCIWNSSASVRPTTCRKKHGGEAGE